MFRYKSESSQKNNETFWMSIYFLAFVISFMCRHIHYYFHDCKCVCEFFIMEERMNRDFSATQSIIQRFTVQSFAVKGFSFAFVGLVSSVVKDLPSISMLLMSVLLVIVLMLLDAYYVAFERVYRLIESDFNVENGLDYHKYCYRPKVLRAIFSKTIILLYIVEIAFLVVLFVNARGTLS